MKDIVRSAAEMTVADMSLGRSHVSLREAGRVVREFLRNLEPTISAWRPWLKYAVRAVIAILDVLIDGDD